MQRSVKGHTQPGATILIVDHDVTSRETIAAALRASDIVPLAARSGTDAIQIAQSTRLDLIVIELSLPDMGGLDAVRVVRGHNRSVPFILISSSVTVAAAVEAMRSGSSDVLEKPLQIERLTRAVRALVCNRTVRAEAGDRGQARFQPRSAAERWALHVLRACDSDGDLKTLEDWATFIGVSYSSLCESCRLLGIRPHDARDLLRVLRAILRASAERCRPDVLLDISDRRTLHALFARAGLDAAAPDRTGSVDAFLDGQQFVRRDNEGLTVLRHQLANRGARRPMEMVS